MMGAFVQRRKALSLIRFGRRHYQSLGMAAAFLLAYAWSSNPDVMVDALRKTVSTAAGLLIIIVLVRISVWAKRRVALNENVLSPTSDTSGLLGNSTFAVTSPHLAIINKALVAHQSSNQGECEAVRPEPAPPSAAQRQRAAEIPQPIRRPVVRLGELVGGESANWDPMRPGAHINNGHMVVIGASGTGKSTMLRRAIESASRQNLPALILDFKDDFSPDQLSRRHRFIDACEGLPFNPLTLHPLAGAGVCQPRLQVYSLSGLLSQVFRLGDQQEALLRRALSTTYEDAGINITGVTPLPAYGPAFNELSTALRRTGNAQLNNRLAPLFELDLFSGEWGSDASSLLTSTTTVRLGMLPSESIQRAVAELLLTSVARTIARWGHCDGIRNLIVIDEAHRVCAVNAGSILLREGRSYGLALWLASQSTSDFDNAVLANAGNLVVLKNSEPTDAQRAASLMAEPGNVPVLQMEIRDLRPYTALIRNDQYRPFRRVALTPLPIPGESPSTQP